MHFSFMHTVKKKVISKSVQLSKLLFMLCWDESLSVYGKVWQWAGCGRWQVAMLKLPPG